MYVYGSGSGLKMKMHPSDNRITQVQYYLDRRVQYRCRKLSLSRREDIAVRKFLTSLFNKVFSNRGGFFLLEQLEFGVPHSHPVAIFGSAIPLPIIKIGEDSQLFFNFNEFPDICIETISRI